MPIFEYRCGACDTQFELLVRPGSAVPACPSCGTTELERLISSFGVSSDGTDYRNRKALGVQQRQKAQAVQKEQSHYRSDHHDD